MTRLLLLVFVTLLLGCSTQTANETAKPIPDASNDTTAESATTPVETSTDDDQQIFVIDVRSKDEWDTGHIEQAVHIPHTEIADRIGEVTNTKDAKIVVYCAAGGRAGKAKAKLEELGFTNVENGGGLDDVKGRFE